MLCNAWVLGSDTNWEGEFSESVFSSSIESEDFSSAHYFFQKEREKVGWKRAC